MSNCHRVAGGSLIDLAASRLALPLPNGVLVDTIDLILGPGGTHYLGGLEFTAVLLGVLWGGWLLVHWAL